MLCVLAKFLWVRLLEAGGVEPAEPVSKCPRGQTISCPGTARFGLLWSGWTVGGVIRQVLPVGDRPAVYSWGSHGKAVCKLRSWRKSGYHNVWGALLVFSGEGPGTIHVLQCAG